MAVISPPEASFIVPESPIWRLTVKQYHEMIDAGILTEDDPVELLEGWLVTKMTQNPQHSYSTQETRDLIASIVPSGWFANDQVPITTGDSEPEPDISVMRGSRSEYRGRHPHPEDVALVIEVADTSLQTDRTVKLRLYARARIPIYWILNLQDRQLEVYSDPAMVDKKPTYRQQMIYHEADEVAVVIGGQEVGRLKVGKLMA